MKSKREREDEALIKVGGGSKKGGKQQKKKEQKDEGDDYFSLNIDLLNSCSFLKISPPKKENLLTWLTDLRAKIDYYNQEGEKRLKEEEEKILAGELAEDAEQEKE